MFGGQKMDRLKDEILLNGEVREGNILKVDNFLNHMLDVELLGEVGKEFYRLFKDEGITKVLTLEASGIAIAVLTAQQFNVPAVFAKKVDSQNLDREVYTSKVFSYTKGLEYTIRVSKKYIGKNDKLLLIDDFLADGNALRGLLDIAKQSGAETKGIGIVIEKGFLDGGKALRAEGYNLKSLAIVESMGKDGIVFRN